MATLPRLRLTAAELASVTVALIAPFASVISCLYAYANRNRKLDVKLIEIGPASSALIQARNSKQKVLVNGQFRS
jgi:hypothetical protein